MIHALDRSKNFDLLLHGNSSPMNAPSKGSTRIFFDPRAEYAMIDCLSQLLPAYFDLAIC